MVGQVLARGPLQKMPNQECQNQHESQRFDAMGGLEEERDCEDRILEAYEVALYHMLVLVNGKQLLGRDRSGSFGECVGYQ